jgi:hypothetical protein
MRRGNLHTLIAGNPKGRNVNVKLPRSYLHESGQEGHMSVFSTVPLKLCVINLEIVLLSLTDSVSLIFIFMIKCNNRE